MGGFGYVLVGILGIAALIGIGIFFYFFKIYIRALTSKAQASPSPHTQPMKGLQPATNNER